MKRQTICKRNERLKFLLRCLHGTYWVLFVAFSCVSCSSGDEKYSEVKVLLSEKDQHSESDSIHALGLTRRAADIIGNPALLGTHGYHDSLEKAVRLLDSALTFKHDFKNALTLKVNALVTLRDYKLALQTIDVLLAQDPDDVETMVLRGLILLRTQNEPAAIHAFKKAISLYNKKIEKRDELSDKLNMAFLMNFTRGNAAAVSEFNELARQYPSNELIEQSRFLFVGFNRDEYLNTIIP